MTAFWSVQSPDYESDYEHSYINGSLEHPFGLPGIECDICGQTWGGIRILKYECLPELRGNKDVYEGWPIGREHHARLQQQVMRALNMRGEPFVALRPGDEFQPCFLDVPSRPQADFLWASLGSMVVSERIKETLLCLCPDEVAVCPVTLRKIGKRSANLPPPMPSTGEPEDIINEVPLLEDGAAAERYYEILVRNESGYPPGGTPVSICPGCKRPEIGKGREIRMQSEMWKGQAIFVLATTLYIIVTDDAKKAIEQLRPTNVVFLPI